MGGTGQQRCGQPGRSCLSPRPGRRQPGRRAARARAARPRGSGGGHALQGLHARGTCHGAGSAPALRGGGGRPSGRASVSTGVPPPRARPAARAGGRRRLRGAAKLGAGPTFERPVRPPRAPCCRPKPPPPPAAAGLSRAARDLTARVDRAAGARGRHLSSQRRSETHTANVSLLSSSLSTHNTHLRALQPRHPGGPTAQCPWSGLIDMGLLERSLSAGDGPVGAAGEGEPGAPLSVGQVGRVSPGSGH
jgi:hypothetical protein